MSESKINEDRLKTPKELDSFEEIVLVDFLDEHWDTWVDHCQRNEANPEKIYKILSGEAD